jgi:hypothetical protein
MTACPYVIDRKGGGYLPCRHEAGHQSMHKPASRDRVKGNSWMTLAEWKERDARLRATINEAERVQAMGPRCPICGVPYRQVITDVVQATCGQPTCEATAAQRMHHNTR